MTLRKPFGACMVILSMLTLPAAAESAPPLDVYAALPDVSMLQLSPSGERVAGRYLTAEGNDVVLVVDLATNSIVSGADAENVKPRRLEFINDEHLLVISSITSRTGIVGRSYEKSDIHAVDVASSEIRSLLSRSQSIHEHQTGLGRMVGSSDNGLTVYMPAFVKSQSSGGSPMALFAVGVDKPSMKMLAQGNQHTIDWFVDRRGRPLVREDFDDRNNVHRIWRLDSDGDESELLYEKETIRPLLSPVGLTREQDSMVVLSESEDGNVLTYYKMSLDDGAITGPILAEDGRSIERVIMDKHRVVHGVEYEGFLPRYAFLDKQLDQRVSLIQQRLNTTSAKLVSWTDGFKKLLFFVSGGWNSGVYMLFENATDEPRVLAASRSRIQSEHVAALTRIEYQARDGMTIPALLTSPLKTDPAEKVPLVVLPHGGPASHDRFEFDWLSQYFASRGYMVLQPQFRGSTGFGREFEFAGHGEFGGKARTDVEDGVKHLIENRNVDPARVCIAGASYGGYLALISGALSPDMYACIVAIAPVSDIPGMLSRLSAYRGKNNWVIDYWESVYGSEASEQEALKTLSPYHHAASFQAPVLLIHGNKDTVVPLEQSKTMRKALRSADKDVTLVRLKGEDHWLSRAETRYETLNEMSGFIDRHLGAGN